MGFLRNLFVPKPKHSQSLTPELDGIFQDLQRAIIKIKGRTKISYLVIIPVLFKIGTELLVKSRGLDSTRLLYENFLSDFDRTQNIPSEAILSVQTPEQPLHHRVEVTTALWSLVNDLVKQGNSHERIGQTFSFYGLELAESKVDKMYSAYLIRLTYTNLVGRAN